MEYGAVADECDQVRCVDRAPAGLCGLDQLVGHRQAGCARSGPLGDLRSQTYCGESAFDRICGAQVHPMLGRVVVELQQDIGVIDDLGDCLGVLGAVVDLECLDRNLGLGDVLSVVDLPECCQRTRVRRFR